MALELTWHGHNTWLLKTDEHRIIIDPFFDENPSCSVAANDVEADFIIISHGHFDHIADAAAIANRTGAQCVAIYEIAQWLGQKHSVADPLGMNIGGRANLPFGSVTLTPAIHSSQLPDGSYGGVAAGLLFEIDSRKIYFACDTALFSDMELIGDRGIDVAVLPIGDLFTMGIEDSIAAVKMLNPRQVLPCHYNTWPPIEQDAAAWAERVANETQAQAIVLAPQEAHAITGP